MTPTHWKIIQFVATNVCRGTKKDSIYLEYFEKGLVLEKLSNLP